MVKTSDFEAATRWECRYLSAPLCHHETPIKQARKRFQENLDAPRGPNSPSETALGDQIPFLQHAYIYIYVGIYIFFFLFSFYLLFSFKLIQKGPTTVTAMVMHSSNFLSCIFQSVTVTR